MRKAQTAQTHQQRRTLADKRGSGNTGREDVDQWSDLKNIKLPNSNPDIDLLIGTNAYKVTEPWEIINSQERNAVQMIKNLTALCKRGEFHLSKWASSSHSVLMSSVPKENRAEGLKELDLDKDNLPFEWALGLQWCVVDDSFTFEASISE
ncbi:hypothetical protein AOLI_G00330900 [Acnodon oligacanthus]